MKLTKAQRRILETLRDAEDRLEREGADPTGYEEDEIVCQGLTCYLGLLRVSPTTVKKLLQITAISSETDSSAGLGNTFYRYRINETGRAILADETQIDAVLNALRKGGSWTWCDGKLVQMKL